MQHLVARNGRDEWVSDGEPSDDALTAAACVELASLLGMDWQEANEALADEPEEEAAAAVAHVGSNLDRIFALLRDDVQRRQARETHNKTRKAALSFIAAFGPVAPRMAQPRPEFLADSEGRN